MWEGESLLVTCCTPTCISFSPTTSSSCIQHHSRLLSGHKSSRISNKCTCLQEQSDCVMPSVCMGVQRGRTFLGASHGFFSKMCELLLTNMREKSTTVSPILARNLCACPDAHRRRARQLGCVCFELASVGRSAQPNATPIQSQHLQHHLHAIFYNSFASSLTPLPHKQSHGLNRLRLDIYPTSRLSQSSDTSTTTHSIPLLS